MKARSFALCALIIVSLLGDLPPLRAASTASSLAPHYWVIDHVDAQKNFQQMGERSLALDSAGRPHLAYGEDHLYYAWRDASIWHLETVDSTWGVGRHTSLALDTADHPHISYHDWRSGDLKYASYNGTAWQIETVESDVGYNRDCYMSLALDALGQPHIAYCLLNDGVTCDVLKYAHYDGANWIIESVESGQHLGWFPALALDQNDRPHISYLSYVVETMYDLKYAHYDGSAWQIETVDGAAGSFTSLVLDQNSLPHISYCGIISSTFPGQTVQKYAFYDGSGWQTEIVDSTTGTGCFASLALDTTGHPHISYLDSYSDTLKYARYDGSDWQIESVDDTVGYPYYSFTSLALDVAAHPHIGYFDPVNYALKYVHYDGSDWISETVDSGGIVGWHTSLALDGDSLPHISYCRGRLYDGACDALKYAHYDGAAWQIETVDNAGDVGRATSLALDEIGHPHISYQDDSRGALKYAYFDGSTWYTETVDTSVGSSWNAFTSLALDAAGHPHIAYFDDVHDDLRYAYSDGISWYTETVDSAGDTGRYVSLALDTVNRPHIGYQGNSDLCYAYYDGSSWITTTVESRGSIGYTGANSSLTLDSADHPHISYTRDEWPHRYLKYAHYDGTAWQTEIVKDVTVGFVGGYSSLALDAANRPHISSYDSPPSALVYRRYNGTAWQVETVDLDGGWFISLVLDPSGLPYISYSDFSSDLVFAQTQEWADIFCLPLVWR